MNKGSNSQSLGHWFFGEHAFAVDPQRRVAIPSEWRQQKAEDNHFFALPGRYRSLQLVPAEVFQELLDQVRKVSFANQKMTLALGKIGSMGHECRCDKQGRIRLTARLAEHAGIDDRAVLVGAITTIQIWNPEAWENHRVDSETGLDAVQAIQENRTDLGTILENLTGGSRQ